MKHSQLPDTSNKCLSCRGGHRRRTHTNTDEDTAFITHSYANGVCGLLAERAQLAAPRRSPAAAQPLAIATRCQQTNCSSATPRRQSPSSTILIGSTTCMGMRACHGKGAHARTSAILTSALLPNLSLADSGEGPQCFFLLFFLL